MSISSVTNRVSYTGNGAVDTYAYTFEIRADADLVVTVKNTSNIETTLTLTTDYTVTGAGSSSGGNVVLVNSNQSWLDSDGDLLTNYVLVIRRKRSPKQETSIRNQGAFYPEGHERFFDHTMMVAQSEQDEIDRSVKLSETTAVASFNPTLPPDIAGVANRVPITNSTGTGWEVASNWVSSSVDTAASAAVSAHAALTATHGRTGDIVGTSDSQTLTNKTISGASNTLSNVNLATQVTGIVPVANATIATQAISASAINWANGNFFTKTLSANTTFTFSGQVTGQCIVVRITNTASNYTVTWPTVKWQSATAPTQTVGAKSDIYTFIYDGTDVFGTVVQNLS